MSLCLTVDFICEANMDSFSGKPQLIVKDIVFRHSQGLGELAAANAPFLLQGFFRRNLCSRQQLKCI